MHNLPELPQKFQIAFEASKAKAELEYVNRADVFPHHPQLAESGLQQLIRIQAVFFAYCTQAREGCRNGDWTVARVSRAVDDAWPLICDYYSREHGASSDEAKANFRRATWRTIQDDPRWKEHLSDVAALADAALDDCSVRRPDGGLSSDLGSKTPAASGGSQLFDREPVDGVRRQLGTAIPPDTKELPQLPDRPETHPVRTADLAGKNHSLMNTESNWISLAECFEKIAREYGPIEVVWFAVAGHENFGNWILDPFHRRPEAARTDFCLAASRASELVGVRPVPIPNVLDHDPQWRDYCRLEEELHALAGQNIDLRDAVPYGFGEVDRDAIDPCTRAWLEVLRQEAAPFSMEPNGWQALKGEKIETIHRKIANVCELSTTFCKRRGRDEIRCRMGDSSAQATGAGAIGEPGPGCETTRQCPKEVIDRFKRRIPKLSYEKLAAKIGINKDTMYAITKELRWVSDETYELVANVCGCKPEDLHPRDIPRPERRR